MSTTGKLLLGILGAAAAGAVVGMLIAPDKGTATRKKMVEGIGKFAIDLADALQSGKENVIAETESYGEEAKDLVGDVKQRAKTAAESIV
jgi:gas vesicle protein